GAGGTGGSGTGGTGGSGTGGTGGSGAGGTGGSGTGGTGGCPTTLPGPKMVEVAAPGGKHYCIDATEISNRQYKSFLDSGQSTDGQSAVCTWNKSYAPLTEPSTCETLRYNPDTRPNDAVSCVDWCDAVAYCEWAGKRLCGRVGGGANLTDRSGDAALSQWFSACSQGGTLTYPYGTVYSSAACYDLYGAAIWPAAVGTLSTCEGGYAGLFDLSGNVNEWEDSCASTQGASAVCLYRGGSYRASNAPIAGDPETVRCASAVSARRDTRAINVGFRCCADL
ncbi:MAG: SUMF1/EgtB/PvdO family nonheme iron enzyme, partial [Sorangiineae bacterium]|nr:SUMF1/EgtB/PvdO family nonheme iron enzyme [Sorangiineae bacterium]